MVLVVVLAGLAGCTGLSQRELQLVRRYLLCQECTEGERDSVVALGGRAVSPLGEALQGPPAAGRRMIERQVAALYDLLPAPQLSRVAFIDHYVANYVASYKTRAAVALGLIDTPRAHALLIAAALADTTDRADVRRAIGSSARILISRIAGDSQSAPVDSFVRTNPSILVTDATTGRALANVRVEFQVAPGRGTVSDTVLRTSANGMATVRWRLGPFPDSVYLLRASAVGQTAQFRAVGRAIGLRLVFLSQPDTVVLGRRFPVPVRVAAVDAWDQPDTTFAENAVVSVPSAGVRFLRTFQRGILDIDSLAFLAPGSGRRLRIQVPGMPPVSSDSFTVLP